MQENYVIINGLKWDRENPVIYSIEHFTHYQALTVAKDMGKRLPTKKEWKSLCDSGSTWDEDRKGIWLGNDHSLKGESKESIFLPAAGYSDIKHGVLNSRGYFGCYWSNSQYRTNIGICLSFYSTKSVKPKCHGHKSYGFSVRCVAEVDNDK